MPLRLASAVAVVLMVGAVATPIAGARSGGGSGGGAGAGSVNEVGVTADEIRIAVVSDVDTPLAPGLFEGPHLAVEAYAKYINASSKPKNTCVAGRKLVVDFYDSKLSADDARNAIIQACENDFAVVGTAALFLENVDDLVQCPDASGKATGLPDLPAVATALAQQCSPVSFSINPSQIDCDTVDAHPQTYRVNKGAAKYLQRHAKDDLHGAYVYANDIKSAEIGTRTLIEGVKAAGIPADSETGVSGRATRSGFTPVVQHIRDDGSNYVLSTGPVSGVVALRQEARAQGIDLDSIVWDCFSNCYDQALIEQGGVDAEGQYLSVVATPFEEASTNAPTAAYLKYAGKDNVDGFGQYAWLDAMLFKEVIDRMVAADGKDALTRARFLEEVAKVHDFDGDGMWGTTDVGRHRSSPCFTLLQVRDGAFERVYPAKPGMRDCKAANADEIQVDLLQ